MARGNDAVPRVPGWIWTTPPGGTSLMVIRMNSYSPVAAV